MWIVSQGKDVMINLISCDAIYYSKSADGYSLFKASWSKKDDAYTFLFRGSGVECERIFQAIIRAIASGDKLFSIPEFHEKYLNATNGNEE